MQGANEGTRLAEESFMSENRQRVAKHLKQYAGRKLTRRLYRSVPWIGGVVALVTIGAAIRKKGFLGGTVDTALDMIPFVGGAKNLVEAGRGRDFIRDKPRLAAAAPRPQICASAQRTSGGASAPPGVAP
jgi:putative toxin of predicted polymorphic toxin system